MIHYLKTIDGNEIDPKQICYITRGGIQWKEDLTGVKMKDGTEQWLEHTCDEVVKAMNSTSN